MIQLGYKPPSAAPVSLTSLSVNPGSVTGGQAATGTVTLSGPAPAVGAIVSLVSANPAASVPSSVTVPANASSSTFTVATSTVDATTAGNISASYGGVSKSAIFTVNPSAPVTPAELSSLSLNPKTVVGGSSLVGTVSLNKVTSSALIVTLRSTKPGKAAVPAKVTVPAGASSVAFTISTAATSRKVNATISALSRGVTKSATLTIVRR